MPAAHEYIVKLFDKEIMAGEFQEVDIIQVAVPAKSSAAFDKFVSGCIASGRVMNTEPNAGEDLVTVAAGEAGFPRVSSVAAHSSANWHSLHGEVARRCLSEVPAVRFER